MMEKKRILEDGLLEQYLTGELSTQDQLLVEQALSEDTEIKAIFDQMEADFERLAFEQAIVPPIRVKDGLIDRIEDKSTVEPNRSLFWIAASFAVLFGLTAIWMYRQWQSAEENFNILKQQTSNLQERLDVLEQDYSLTSSQLNQINGPNVIPLVLYGNQKSPNAKLVAYIDHSRKLVIVNSQGLPALPDSHTYQMWSDVDGEMINMGILEPKSELISLKYIEKAESLNITVEPAGGNDHATVEELISAAPL